MANEFNSLGQDLSRRFVTDYKLIDQYVMVGTLWTWGGNRDGTLGNGTSGNGTFKSSPIQTSAGGTNWKSVSVGNTHAAGIKTDGTMWLWGNNYYGVLGFGNGNQPVLTPTQGVAGTNWAQVSCGSSLTAAIKTDGTLWLWGSNGYSQLNRRGQIGNGTITDVQQNMTQTSAGGNNWKQVSCRAGHVAAVKTDGTLWLWGNNSYGKLGDGTTVHRSVPVQTIAGGTNWKQVSVGFHNTAAIKTDGTLWTWGQGGAGANGDNTTVDRSSPIQTISAGTNWASVTAGKRTTAGIKTDGSLWLWGYNQYGELGDNTRVSKSSPVQTVAAGTNWKLVASGRYFTAAVKTDGTLWLWGRNTYYGNLGDNTTASKSSPVQTVAGGTNWKLVAAGDYLYGSEAGVTVAAITYGSQIIYTQVNKQGKT